jgi:anti-sigma regulatory factor (Ser/Thr protein kinase)
VEVLNVEIRRKIAATAEAAEELCAAMRSLFADLNERTAFAAELLLREALANAIAHGSRAAAPGSELVTCIVRRRRRRLTIAVRDEGPGFAWKSRLEREMDEGAESGRGLLIYRQYAERFRFSAAGNVIVIWLQLKC